MLGGVSFPIKVINLRRSADRRETFARLNSHLEYEFVEAVDGNKLTEKELEDPTLFKHPLPFHSMGAYGCALSHLKMWDLAIASGRPVTVCEDDVVFRKDFKAQSAAVLERLPADWDIVLWGWNFNTILSLMSLPGISPAVMLCDENLLRENIEAFRNLTVPSQPLALDRTLGTPGYTISAAGAKKFREQCFPMKDFEIYFPLMNRNLNNHGIDVSMARTYSVARSFVAFPPLLATENDRSRSTVQPQGPAAAGSAKIAG